MASGLITSWQMDGQTVETVADFISLGSKITAGGDCSHEIKRRLLLGRKVMTNLDSILKSRDITLPTKVHLVKATAFPVVMYGCESWTIKKAECQRMLKLCTVVFISHDSKVMINILQARLQQYVNCNFQMFKLDPEKMKSLTVSIVSPSICHEMMGPDAMILVF